CAGSASLLGACGVRCRSRAGINTLTPMRPGGPHAGGNKKGGPGGSCRRRATGYYQHAAHYWHEIRRGVAGLTRRLRSVPARCAGARKNEARRMLSTTGLEFWSIALVLDAPVGGG